VEAGAGKTPEPKKIVAVTAHAMNAAFPLKDLKAPPFYSESSPNSSDFEGIVARFNRK
jgi:hypothetical protein